MLGGGGGGGGGMLRVVGRSVARAGVTNLQDPISSSSSSSSSQPASSATSPLTHKPNSSNTPNNINLSSSSGHGSPFFACNNNNNNNTTDSSANYGVGYGSPYCCWPPFVGDDCEWVSVDVSEDESSVGLADDFVMGHVPSVLEVHNAVSALAHVFDTASNSQLVRDRFGCNGENDTSYGIPSASGFLHPVSSVGSELDWVEPSPYLCNPKMLQPYASKRVYDAFNLLQNDPSVQKMVVSLSSDKAVWEAVLNNDVVRELRETYHAEEGITPSTSEGSDETVNSNPALNLVKWIFENTKGKIMEVFEKITELANELFKSPGDQNATAGTADIFEEKIRTSFLLSVLVLLVVVVTRAKMDFTTI